MSQILIYGAYGYTGRLLAGIARNANVTVVLAGRNENKLQELAAKMNLPFSVFDLENEGKLEEVLKDTSIVINAAGPFTHTAKKMMEACLKTKTHYLDITGEIEVFELAKSFSERAVESDIMLMPGVGFDVVPTDCMAAFLKKQLPEAVSLELAFAPLGKGGASRGTALTMVENLGKPGAIRKEGVIAREAVGERTMRLPLGDKKLFFISIPWGDVSTAFYTTKIPNIVTYMSIPPKQYKWIKRQRYFNWLLRSNFVKKIAKNKINKGSDGPSAMERFNSKTLVWGLVRDASGKKEEARIIIPNGYDVTADMGIRIARKILNGNWNPGFQTPAGCYGEGLILEMDGIAWERPF